MNCRRCGKALGTDRGICPFCGAMLSEDQMKIYKQDKKENMYRPELITEKFTGNSFHYEKNESHEKGLVVFLFILGILLVLLVLVLLSVLN